MIDLGNSIVSLVNGLYSILNIIISPNVILAFILFVSLIWVFLIEIDELDRQGTRPEIGRH
jgi:hypothetical protein